jgi:hypothetical protein
MTLSYLLHSDGVERGTGQYDLSHLAARSAWHAIFDDLPLLENRLADESSELLRRFRRHCFDSGRSLSWSRHAAFFDWLKSIDCPHVADAGIVSQFMVAIANAWASDHTVDMRASHCVVVHPACQHAIGAQRALNFADKVRVVKLAVAVPSELAIGLNNTFGIARSRSWSVGAFGPVA